MKVLIVSVFVLSSFSLFASDFCDGFKDGFKEGYCDTKGRVGCVAPWTPVCPIAKPGEYSYRDGYNTGFKQGMRRAYND